MDDTTISSLMSRLGSLGGKARAKSLTKKERTLIAKNAALARWSKRNEQKILPVVPKSDKGHPTS